MHSILPLIRFTLRNYAQDRCLRSAAALCYTTLLSLVPLTAVIFSIFAAFPVFQELATEIQNFVFSNFVPASGEVVQHYLQEFTDKASKLTAIGIALLVLMALMLMNTIEGAINEIWHITTTRRALPKFMVYWAVLTLGPLLIGASLAISSYLISLPLFNETALISNLKGQLLGLLPFFATTLACALLYTVVPDTHVPLRHAMIGALVAAALFEISKKAFALYITSVPTYEVIYGALAAIPIFLLWLYLSWAMILFGGVLVYSLGHFHSRGGSASSSDDEHNSGLQLLYDFRLIGQIWRGQCDGELITSDDLFSVEQQLDETAISNSLQRLEDSRLIHQSVDNRWGLSKEMSNLTLDDLYSAQTYTPPKIEQEWLNKSAADQALFDAINNTNSITDSAMKQLLRPLYETPSSTENST